MKDKIMLGTRAFTSEEEALIDSACHKLDGTVIPKPVFYHLAIVNYAQQSVKQKGQTV